MGWGTPEQILDPAYAAGKFYEQAGDIPGWQTMPLTEAAQAVQRSAFPDAYAKHEPFATEIVNTLAERRRARPPGRWSTCSAPTGSQIAASGWTVPVVAGSAPASVRRTGRPTTASTSRRRRAPSSTPPRPAS